MTGSTRARALVVCALFVAVLAPGASRAQAGDVVSSVYANAQALRAVSGTHVVSSPGVDLPGAGGGPFTKSTASESLAGIVSVQALTAGVRGTGTPYPSANGAATAGSSVAHVSILNGVVQADAASARCDAGRTGSSGDSSLLRAVVGGHAAAASPPPNTTITVPGVATVVLDEVSIEDRQGPGDNYQAVVNAIHVTAPPGADPPTIDVVVGHVLCRTQVVAPPDQPPTITVVDGSSQKHTGSTTIGTSSQTSPEEPGNETLGWVVPDGPQVGPLGPSDGATGESQVPTTSSAAATTASTASATRAGGPAIARAPARPVQFDVNTGHVVAPGCCPIEPSGADNGAVEGNDVVLYTSNTVAAYSTDGGSKFTSMNINGLFPTSAVNDDSGNQIAGGRCCDQVVQYDAFDNLFFWVMQFGQAKSGKNLDRIAWTSPEELANNGSNASWTYIDITSNDLGIGGDMDYPDLSVGANYLYLSTDGRGSGQGFFVVRMSLADIVGPGCCVGWRVGKSSSSDTWGAHLAQFAPNDALYTEYWAGHPNNSTLRVYSWAESDNAPTSHDITINSYCDGNISSLDPSGNDWLAYLGNPAVQGFPGNAVMGAATQAQFGIETFSEEVWMAWSTGTTFQNGKSCGFAQPHVELVEFDPFTYSLIGQHRIWSSNRAFAYPALAADESEVAMTLGIGGGGTYPDQAVGFWGDFVVYRTGHSNESSPTFSNRWGDYLAIRPTARADLVHAFDAEGYSIVKPPPTGGSNFDTHFVVFGRIPPPPPS